MGRFKYTFKPRIFQTGAVYMETLLNSFGLIGSLKNLIFFGNTLIIWGWRGEGGF